MANKVLNVVLMCAGKSSRLGLNLPKVILPINGKSLIERTIKTLQHLKPKKIILVVGFKKDLVIDLVKSLNFKNIHIVEQKKQLGTGDAVKKAIAKMDLNSQLLVLNGDTPFIDLDTIKRSIRDFNKKNLDLNFATTKPRDPFGYGRIFRSKNRKIERIIEEKDCNDEQREINEVNSGLYLFKTSSLKKFLPDMPKRNGSEYYLTDLIEIFSRNNKKITTTQVKDDRRFLNINTIDDYRKAHELDKIFFYEECIKKNILLKDPFSIVIDQDVNISKNVSIGPNVQITGKSKIDQGVVIEGNCLINNSKIGANTLVKPFVSIDNSVVGKDCQLGPFSNLRPDTILSNQVKIGNYVEIKKSNIGNKSKVPHLSYIGDTDMGSRVNIGAGSITCNYDGFDKHKTTIGDEVFVGSNTMMVAPVTLGKKSTTGAGTVLSKNLSENTLGITRIKEKQIPNWNRKPKIKK